MENQIEHNQSGEEEISLIDLPAAFALNAVAGIKEDPQASKVISDAWKAGK